MPLRLKACRSQLKIGVVFVQERLSPQLEPLQPSRPGSPAGDLTWNLAALQPQVLQALSGTTASSTASACSGGGGHSRSPSQTAPAAEVWVRLGGDSDPAAHGGQRGAGWGAATAGLVAGAAAAVGPAISGNAGSLVAEALVQCGTCIHSCETEGVCSVGSRPAFEFYHALHVLTPVACRVDPTQCSCGPAETRYFWALNVHRSDPHPVWKTWLIQES